MAKTDTSRSNKSKETSNGILAWLKIKSNRTVLAWIGSCLVVVAGGLWKVYLHFEERAQKTQTRIVSPEEKSKTADDVQAVTKRDDKPNAGAQIQQKAEASNGGVAINVGRDVNINK